MYGMRAAAYTLLCDTSAMHELCALLCSCSENEFSAMRLARLNSTRSLCSQTKVRCMLQTPTGMSALIAVKQQQTRYNQ